MKTDTIVCKRCRDSWPFECKEHSVKPISNETRAQTIEQLEVLRRAWAARKS